MRSICALILSFLVQANGFASEAHPGDLDTELMLATFKLSSPPVAATCFMLTRPVPDSPAETQFILVTAEHALCQIKEDAATVTFRKRQSAGGYSKLPAKLQIRQNGKALWTRHPNADVAVMYVTPPSDAAIAHVPVDLLASDADLQRYEIHPGDTVKCIGFPHANQFQANEAGFGVVRTGCIASFPLLPTKNTKTFYFDFNTFEGDSGGPVYLSENNRFFGNQTHEGRTRLILGVAVAQQFLDEEFKTVYQTGKFRHQLGLGVVVHSTAIREAIDLLPRDP